MSIAGKVALVTGGAKGIGRAIVLRLARDGADVAIADLDEEKANAVADDVRVMSRKSIVIVTDVSDRDEVFAAVERTASELGGFDVIVNNAGIAQVQTIEDVRLADLELIQRINVGGVLWGIQAAAAPSSCSFDTAQDHQCVIHRRPRRFCHARSVLFDEVRGVRT